MSGGYTPGPWAAHKYLGKEDNWFVRGPDDERICGQGSGHVLEGNARLIAAAPELVEALRKARGQVVAFSLAELGSEAAVKNVEYIDALLTRIEGDRT